METWFSPFIKAGPHYLLPISILTSSLKAMRLISMVGVSSGVIWYISFKFISRLSFKVPHLPHSAKAASRYKKPQHKPNFTANSLMQYLFHQNSSGFVLKFSLGMRTCKSVIRFFCLHKLYFLTGYWRINICIQNSKHIGTHIFNTFI